MGEALDIEIPSKIKRGKKEALVDYLFTESKDHDLVRAIYEDCEYTNNFKGIKNLIKYKQYPRNTGRF